MATVTIIGAGMMGSGICRPVRDNGHEVRLVGTPLDRDIIDEARRTGWHITLKRRLPDGVSYYQIEEVSAALAGADLVICGVSSFGLEWFAEAILPVLLLDVPVLSVTKGLLGQADGALMTYPHYLENRLPESKRGRILFNAIGGPCTSYELMDRHQTLVYFCGRDAACLAWLQSLLTTDYYHITISTDIVGVEVCVALKNAYAVGVSMAIGMAERIAGPDAYMYNPQAALFGQSLREMTRLVRLLGGDSDLVAGIPGAGDLYVTIFGGRTRRLGYLLGKGVTYQEAREQLQGVTLESVVIITRVAAALRARAIAGAVDAADFPLLMFLDRVINEGALAEIPWRDFR